MSKIQDALKRASEERDLRHESRPMEIAAGTPDLWQEVRRLENSLANWTARQTPPAAGYAQPSAETSAPAGPARKTATAAWKDALTQCESRLSSCDEQIVRRLEDQAALEAQVDAQAKAAAQAQTVLVALQHRLVETQRAVKSAEASKASLQRKTDALRECQKLSDACGASEQELRASEEMIARTLDYQQRMADKLAEYRSHRQTVQRTIEGLQRQLQQALARVDAAGEPNGAAHE